MRYLNSPLLFNLTINLTTTHRVGYHNLPASEEKNPGLVYDNENIYDVSYVYRIVKFYHSSKTMRSPYPPPFYSAQEFSQYPGGVSIIPLDTGTLGLSCGDPMKCKYLLPCVDCRGLGAYLVIPYNPEPTSMKRPPPPAARVLDIKNEHTRPGGQESDEV